MAIVNMLPGGGGSVFESSMYVGYLTKKMEQAHSTSSSSTVYIDGYVDITDKSRLTLHADRNGNTAGNQTVSFYALKNCIVTREKDATLSGSGASYNLIKGHKYTVELKYAAASSGSYNRFHDDTANEYLFNNSGAAGSMYIKFTFS